MRPKTLLTLAVIIGFVALLTWTSLSAQKISCDICVDYNGGHQCATASHSTEAEAARSAQTSACGPLSHGMSEIILCESRPPATRKCRHR